MSRRAIVLALNGLVLAGLPAVSGAAGAITGTVRDAASGEPLAGAAVWLEIIEGGCRTTRVETGEGSVSGQQQDERPKHRGTS